MRKLFLILLFPVLASAQFNFPRISIDTLRGRTNLIRVKDSTQFNSFVQMKFQTFAPTEIAGYGFLYVKADSTINWATLGYTHNLDSVTLASSLSGSGVAVYKDRSGLTERFKRLDSLYGISITDMGDSIGFRIDTILIPTRATAFKWNVAGSAQQQDSLRMIPTTNQVNISQSGHTATFSLPQSIATTSTPSFSGLFLNPTGSIDWIAPNLRIKNNEIAQRSGNLLIYGDTTNIGFAGSFTSIGFDTIMRNSLIYADNRQNATNLFNVATGQVLTSQGTTTIPAWSATPSITGLSLSGLTAGSVPFIGTGGRFRENNTAFKWDSTNAKLILLKTISSAAGGENNDNMSATLVGNQTEASYATNGGSAITGRVKIGNNSSATGTFQGIVGHIKTFASSNDSSESSAGYFDNSMDTNYAGTQWGLDVVTQTGKVKPNFMVGISSLVNNFYNGTSKRGMYGLSVVSRPVATGDNSAQYSGQTTYQIDALAAIGGWAGLTYGARTSVAKDALRIGGLVSNWQGQTEGSVVDTGINIRDYSKAGIYIHDPYTANTPSILVGANGGVAGFGLTNPSSRNIVDIYRSDTNSTGTTIGANIVVENAPTATSTATMRGISTVPQVQSANANNVSRMDGIRSAPNHGGTGTVTDMYGGLFIPTKSSTGPVTNAYGGFFRVDNTNATGAITNGYGVFIPAFTTTGAITNAWGVYQAGSGGGNYFAANTSVGSTTTTSQFNVGSSAQLQVNSSGVDVKRNAVTVPSTEHWQYAPYADTVSRTGQTATISAQNINNSSTNGVYRVSYYVYTTTAGTSGTVTLSIKWNDGAAQTVTSTAITFGVLGAYVQGTTLIHVTNSTAATWETTVTSAVGNPVYSVDLLCERLW